jgi:hypothetical protein
MVKRACFYQCSSSLKNLTNLYNDNYVKLCGLKWNLSTMPNARQEMEWQYCSEAGDLLLLLLLPKHPRRMTLRLRVMLLKFTLI